MNWILIPAMIIASVIIVVLVAGGGALLAAWLLAKVQEVQMKAAINQAILETQLWGWAVEEAEDEACENCDSDGCEDCQETED